MAGDRRMWGEMKDRFELVGQPTTMASPRGIYLDYEAIRLSGCRDNIEEDVMRQEKGCRLDQYWRSNELSLGGLARERGDHPQRGTRGRCVLDGADDLCGGGHAR